MSAFIIINGRAGKDGTHSMSKNGKDMYSFSAATSYKYGEEWKSNWYNVTVFGEQARQLNVKKGDTVIVTGSEQHSKYKNRSGNEVLDVRITAEKVHVIPAEMRESKREAATEARQPWTPPVDVKQPSFGEEDIPF